MAYTTVPKSSAYFTPKLITGNGGTQNITGLNFQPDFTWIKGRDVAESHALFDAPRGVTKRLTSDTTGAETTVQGVTAFNSDGFTLGALSAVNQNNGLFASWNWKGGTTSGIATNGSTQITPSSYSFNQTSGFSIIRYTGIGGQPKTIPHGLGVQPKMFIIKRLNSTGSWGVLPQQISTGHLYLDAVSALSTVNPLSGGVLADTVNFSVSNSGDVNASGGTYVAYCFADVQGFSKFGSYIGNGNADGTFVYTGFKPALVIFKKTSGTGGWNMFDTKRDPFNVQDQILRANGTNAEASDSGYSDNDFLSNGFKLRQTWGEMNGSGATYIYMAFAEAPFVGTNNVPANAR